MKKYRIRYSPEHGGYFIDRRIMFFAWWPVSYHYTEDGARAKLDEMTQNPERIVTHG